MFGTIRNYDYRIHFNIFQFKNIVFIYVVHPMHPLICSCLSPGFYSAGWGSGEAWVLFGGTRGLHFSEEWKLCFWTHCPNARPNSLMVMISIFAESSMRYIGVNSGNPFLIIKHHVQQTLDTISCRGFHVPGSRHSGTTLLDRSLFQYIN
jgi:hypothetical protein